jgi:HEPN domain-containing protein
MSPPSAIKQNMKESYFMQNHEKWLLKAENDLNAAKVLYEANYLDVAIYHTQQCAEKSLKGFLALCKHPLVKTHDLTSLVALSKQFDPKFSKIGSAAEKLTPFGIAFRYPEFEIYPKKNVVLQAIQDAEEILKFVKDRVEKYIPKHPQKLDLD